MNYSSKPRVVVLTDFFKDPDDKQSMIRFLSYANEFDVEGLIATSLAYGTGEVHPEWVVALIDMYEKVRPSLLQHDDEYPSADALRRVVKAGAPVIREWVGGGRGFATPQEFADDSRSCGPPANYIGPDQDTPASEHITQVLTSMDPRPVWIIVWGGPMDLAQALWRLRNDLGADSTELNAIIGKIRLFQISWQDTGAVWLWDEFPELFRIQCDAAMRGMYTVGDPTYRNQEWLDEHVKRNHGPLGEEYPVAGRIDGIKEGDTPSFLHLLRNGLSNPEEPTYGSWGGRFRPQTERPNCFIDDPDQELGANSSVAWTVARWSQQYNLDFAARMDWCVSSYGDANHAPKVCLNGTEGTDVVYQQARSGDVVELSAEGTSDPDGDSLSYRWWCYREAGSYPEDVCLENATSCQASFVAPTPTRENETIHIILEVTDNGTPNLTRYRRLVIELQQHPISVG